MMKMVDLKRKSFISLFLFSSVFLIYFFGLMNDYIEYNFFHRNYILMSGPSDGHKGCDIPFNLNPFDDTIKKLINPLPSNIKCKNSFNKDNSQDITFIEYINETAFLKMRPNFENKCFYQFFAKSNFSDDLLDYKETKLLDPINGIQFKEYSFANVSCFKNADQIYKNFHYVIPKMRIKSNESKNRESKPSVLILVIESLSRLNYLRFLNKTKHSLEKLNRVTYLEGLTKLADNSFPNMVPLLAGKRMYVGEYADENSGPYDDWPFIWKQFESKGYATALIEDNPDYTLFNYESKGFVRDNPTVFYPRPFWLHMYRYHDTSNYCLDQRIPKIEVLFQQIRTFIEVNHNSSRPYFAFSFYIEVTHDDFNKVQLLDSHISQFIHSIHKLLNNTILIVMGDHGTRYGPILETVIGRIEERMPLFAIHLPKLLHQKYPHLQHFLNNNNRKLISWLDLHQLLLDVVQDDYSPLVDPRSRFNSHVYSPWRESIPFNRSCKEALIPDNYCVCDKRSKIETTHQLVVEASNQLINYLNQLVPMSLCQRLSLNTTLNSELILPSDSTAKRKGFQQKIEITIKVNPNEALFRGQLFRTAWSQKWSVKDDVTRLNRYANQSDCVHERVLKKFCYCL